MPDLVISDSSRMFLIQGRAGPGNIPEYEGLWRAGQPSWDQGNITVVRNPSPTQYGAFVPAGKIIGAQGNPTLPVTARYLGDRASVLLKIARNGCDHDLQVHMGSCQVPTDFERGWDKVLVLENARPTTWGTDTQLGALDTGDRNAINEQVPFTGIDMYEVTRMLLAEQAAAAVVQNIADIQVCDTVSCGLCGLQSDGCKVVFALQDATAGSPGLPPRIQATRDGGATWVTRTIQSHTVNVNANAVACVGTRLAVVSNGTNEGIHYATINDILNSVETWTKVQTGLVLPAGAPNDIFTLGSSQIWIVGNGGYIYRSTDITAGVTVLDAGTATTQNLNAIHGSDAQNLVAVGANNAVVYTRNGGSTWASVTGPAVGAALNTVWVVSQLVWWVGTATGRLFYTLDGGTSWTEKAFPGSGSGVVRDMVFATPSVGYMSHDTTTPTGRILRTINGGASWYVAPEGTGSIPGNQRINALSVCQDPNIVFGGGLATAGIDGIIVKGAGV